MQINLEQNLAIDCFYSWVEALMAIVAGDLQAAGVHSGGYLLHPLHLLHLFSGSLPDQSGSREVFLRQLQLPSRHLPHSLSVSILQSDNSNLLLTLSSLQLTSR